MEEKEPMYDFLPVSAIKTPGRTTYIKGTVDEVIERINFKKRIRVDVFLSTGAKSSQSYQYL